VPVLAEPNLLEAKRRRAPDPSQPLKSGTTADYPPTPAAHD